MDAKHMGEYGWKWMSGSSTLWHGEMNHTYSKQPDWAGYQKTQASKTNLKKTDQQQWINKKHIKKWLNQFSCELQLKPVHWPTHSLLALASFTHHQGSEHLLPSTEVLALQSIVEILLMDKALHQFDMANEYKYNQIHTGLRWTVSSLSHLIQHVTLIPQLMNHGL